MIWETTHAEHITPEADQLLADGWEPFAVIPAKSQDPRDAVVFFRRPVKDESP